MEEPEATPWPAHLRQSCPKKKKQRLKPYAVLLTNTNTKLPVSSLEEAVSVLRYRVREALQLPLAVQLFLIADGKLLRDGYLADSNVKNGTRVRAVAFGGRRVLFAGAFRRPRGLRRVAIKTLGERTPDAHFVFDLQPGDTVLGVKLAIEDEHPHLKHNELVIYERPLARRKEWTALVELDDDRPALHNGSLYVRHVQLFPSALPHQALSPCSAKPKPHTLPTRSATLPLLT